MGQKERGRPAKERHHKNTGRSGGARKKPNKGHAVQSSRTTTTKNGVVVEGGSERWLKRGFQWVYPNEILAKQNGLTSGRQVDIVSQSGEHLGCGIWDDGWIAVRRFLKNPGKIDQSLFFDRIATAREHREQILDDETNAYRLVNAENDGLPGIRIDMFGSHALISLDSPALLSILTDLTKALETVMKTRGVYLAWRPDPRDSFDVKSAPRSPGLISGHPHKGPLRVTERGVACLVDLHGEKSVGVFLDMRANRAWLENYWGGKRVLNLFAHTGFFSVVAAINGASEVTSVDLSSHYLDRAEQNFIANDLDPTNHSFIEGDVRKVLDRFRRKEERFDIAILDPPSFSHGPAGVLSLKKDYPGLVSSTLRVLENGGWLVAALNLGEVSPRDFHTMVHKGAQKAGDALQLIFEGGQGPDFPAHVDFPEGRYLKFGVWRKVIPV